MAGHAWALIRPSARAPTALHAGWLQHAQSHQGQRCHQNVGSWRPGATLRSRALVHCVARCMLPRARAVAPSGVAAVWPCMLSACVGNEAAEPRCQPSHHHSALHSMFQPLLCLPPLPPGPRSPASGACGSATAGACRPLCMWWTQPTRRRWPRRRRSCTCSWKSRAWRASPCWCAPDARAGGTLLSRSRNALLAPHKIWG